MDWTILLKVCDVNGESIAASELELWTWAGVGNVEVQPRKTIEADSTIIVAQTTTTLVFHISHARFAPLSLNLNREKNENVWRWTDPRQSLSTRGSDVIVVACLLRITAAPVLYISEEELVRKATAAKTPMEKHAKSMKKPVPNVRIENLKGVLTDKNKFFYRNSGVPTVGAFNLLLRDPLKDESALGWDRFNYSIVPNLSPMKNGRMFMLEYGEVGSQPARGPKFLVGVFLPNELLRMGRKTIDLMVWFTPNTRWPFYPHAEYPFRGDYPYLLEAPEGDAPYASRQKYVEVSFAHLSTQHYLSYQMIAARKACAIVVPVAPSSHFELWTSPATLMRMLKEIVRWLPRDDDGRHAKVHPIPPSIGRVGVSGFSAAGEHLLALLEGRGAALHYSDSVWGSVRDASDFRSSWGELWAIDNNLAPASFRNLLDRGATWSRQGNRNFRVYKNNFTGFWDPSAETVGPFAKAIKGGKVDLKGVVSWKSPTWAVSVSDASGGIRAVSVSNDYVVSPAATGTPSLPNSPHENMPRIFFGHAAVTSGYSALSK